MLYYYTNLFQLYINLNIFNKHNSLLTIHETEIYTRMDLLIFLFVFFMHINLISLLTNKFRLGPFLNLILNLYAYIILLFMKNKYIVSHFFYLFII